MSWKPSYCRSGRTGCALSDKESARKVKDHPPHANADDSGHCFQVTASNLFTQTEAGQSNSEGIGIHFRITLSSKCKSSQQISVSDDAVNLTVHSRPASCGPKDNRAPVFVLNTPAQRPAVRSLRDSKGRGSKVSVWLPTQTRRCALRHLILAALILPHGVYCLASGVQIKRGRKKNPTQRSVDLRHRLLIPRSPDDCLCFAVRGQNIYVTTRSVSRNTIRAVASVFRSAARFAKLKSTLAALGNRNKSQVCAKTSSCVGN